MNAAARHITGAGDSRKLVSSIFHERYQDCGHETALATGNLDAADRMSTGSTYALREIEHSNRNAPAPKLANREGVSP